MKRPVPPSNFRSSGDAAEDLRRIRQHQQEILDWIDAQHAFITETSGPTDLTVGAVADGQYLKRVGATLVGATVTSGVTSFNARTGAVVPTTGDYTATQVGLGNVTNDAQLKRAGSDWSGFTVQTGTPAAADVFLIERASDSAKRAVTFSNLQSSNGRNGFPLLEIPPSPDAWNLETRQWTDPDLANNGWSITLLASPYTTQTRAGNVDLTSDPSANTYRSELRNGVLLLQFPLNVPVLIFKTTTNAAWSYKGHFWHTDSAGISTLGLFENAQRFTGASKSFYTGVENGKQLVYTLTAPATFSTTTNLNPMTDNATDSVRVVHQSTASGNLTPLHQDAMNGRISLSPAFSTGIGTAAAGIIFNSVARSLCYLDFLRRTTLLQAP